jgi:hypothetical protein
MGDDHEPRSFSTFSPCVIALIGQLPDTLKIDASSSASSGGFLARRSSHTGPNVPIISICWHGKPHGAADHAAQVAELDPAMPPGVYNRAHVGALLAIAAAPARPQPPIAKHAGEDASRGSTTRCS